MAETSKEKRKGRDWLSIAGMAAVAGAAAFTSYSGWAGLAEMAGWNHVLAKFLPITVDAYAMTATRVWLSPAKLTAKARKWARNNAVGAISISVLGNAFYHAAAAGVLQVTWPVVVALSAVPPITLGLTTHLWHLADDTEPEPAPGPGAASPGPAIAEPDAVRAAYPILGNPSALSLPATGAPSASRPSAPGRLSAQASAPHPSAPSALRSSAPRPQGASAVRASAPPAASAEAIARSWEEREAQLLPKAREVNAREIADGNGPASARLLAKELHLGHANAGKLLKALGDNSAPHSVGRPPAAPAGHPGSTSPHAPAPVLPPSGERTPGPHGAAPERENTAPGAHPSATPSAPRLDGSGAPGPLAPGALPTQREARTERVNGASVELP